MQEQGNMAIYMNFNNKSIKGNVTAAGYEDWIELDSFQRRTSSWCTGTWPKAPATTSGHSCR